MIRDLVAHARKIVFKFGSTTLTGADGTIDFDFLATFAGQCAALTAGGTQAVLVSSGA
ncbi:MAG: glutamate 5-kinase, partial [Spirochaetaceae bacterium]|nr:glutamate 5-kinase [Spirochaetaceae bacterium]